MKSDILSSLNPAQQEAVLYCDGPQLVVAGPGSGKTRVLTYKIAHLVTKLQLSPSQILAVTFTNKAATEIKNRVSELLAGYDLGGIWMGTFHGICARILRTHGKLINIPTNFTIYDDNDSKQLIKSIMKDLKIDPQKIAVGAVSSNISSAKSELIDASSFTKYSYGAFRKGLGNIQGVRETA